jgi:hypothetical protein
MLTALVLTDLALTDQRPTDSALTCRVPTSPVPVMTLALGNGSQVVGSVSTGQSWRFSRTRATLARTFPVATVRAGGCHGCSTST